MFHQIIKFNGILLLFVALLFASCEKDSILSENFTSTDTENFNRRGPQGGPMNGNRDCFELVFPVTVEFPDGTTADAADKEALKDAVKAWKEANPDVEGRPQLVMPFDITLEDGTIVTIEDEETLQAIKEDCRPDGQGGHGQRKCFTPVFPVTLNFPDGTSAEAADKESFKALLMAWKEANPDATERPSIAMPYDVEMKDGTVVTIESEEDLIALKEDCGEGYDGPHVGERCFTLNFPVTVNFPDGTTADAADKAALRQLRREWRQDNPDAEEKPSLAFPLEVTMSEDDTVVTVNSMEELIALKESCED